MKLIYSYFSLLHWLWARIIKYVDQNEHTLWF